MTVEGGSQKGQVLSDFSEYMRILLARRWVLVRFVGIASFVAVLLSLIGPQTYRAQVTLLPEESKVFSLPSMLQDATGMDLISGVGKREGLIFLEMLKSRSVGEGIVRQCDLVRKWKFDRLPAAEGVEQSLLALKKRAKFEKTEGGIIVVEVSVGTTFLPSAAQRRRTAEDAAAIANAYADQLNRVNQEKATSRARAVRIYLEDQIRATETRLKAESDSLVRMQLKDRAIAIEEQTKEAIRTAGELQGQIIATEMQLDILRRTRLPENSEIRTIESKLQELRRQYSKLEYGGSSGTAGSGRAGETGGGTESDDSKDFSLAFAALPAIAQQQAALMRDLAVQQTVYELLNQQYYRAKIQETGDVPSLMILDRAIPPVYRAWPKRSILVISTFIVALFAGILFVFGLEFRDSRSGVPVPPGPSDLREAWNVDRAALRRRLSRSPGRG
jgi:tyrosine-protein kinase Etk/Wzc